MSRSASRHGHAYRGGVRCKSGRKTGIDAGANVDWKCTDEASGGLLPIKGPDGLALRYVCLTGYRFASVHQSVVSNRLGGCSIRLCLASLTADTGWSLLVKHISLVTVRFQATRAEGRAVGARF